MKRPASQYYWGDWRRDTALQACSLAARGLWHEMNCLMHDCDPYGHLCVGASAMSHAQLARLVGITAKECGALMAELETAGVFSRTADGLIYSRRMVRDEDLRERRANGGQAGAEHGSKGAQHGAKGGRPRKAEGGFETPHAGQEKPPPASASASALPISTSEISKPQSLAASAIPPTPPPAFLGDANAEALNGRHVAALDAAWELPTAWGFDAEKLGWKPPDVLHESERFRQYWASGKGAGTRRSVKGWRQSWSNWLAKAERMGR